MIAFIFSNNKQNNKLRSYRCELIAHQKPKYVFINIKKSKFFKMRRLWDLLTFFYDILYNLYIKSNYII